MFEKLIENWLINVHELGYQVPFCEVLITEEYKILHVSRHGRGEHGKDVVARDPKGNLVTYQLKGGDITLPVWRQIRGEVEDLVRLPVLLPGIKRDELHIPVLVTNGEIRGDALTSIQEYAEDWERRGSPRMRVCQRHELLSMFIKSHGSYLPADLTDFRQFVELYVGGFYDRLPREKFAAFLSKLVSADLVSGRGPKKKRAIESMVLIGSYILEQYERVRNHISAIEGWTIIASTIMHLVERERLAKKDYQSSLNLIWIAVERNLYNFEHEALERTHFIEPNFILAETDNIRGARVLISLGWLAVFALLRMTQGKELPERENLIKTFRRELPHMRLGGEADWPYIVCICIFLEKMISSGTAESYLNGWVRNIIRNNSNKESNGLPSPYWLQEKVLSLHYGQIPPYQQERFAGHSFTIHSALDMLVRRLCRQHVASSWAQASRITFCDYLPDESAEWFLWRSEKGYLRSEIPQQPVSWSKWRTRTAIVERNTIPKVLLNHSEWLLPFVLTYPHRMNRDLNGLVDCLIGERADLV